MDIVIDGYNLMHFAGLARARYGPGDLERARDRLLRRLANTLHPEELERTTVVFDGQYALHQERAPLKERGMTVLYSAPGEEADDLIERRISEHSSPRNLVIVSSDRRLHRAARRARATAIKSEEFLAELHRRRARQKPTPDSTSESEAKLREVPASALDSWLEEFADVDVAELEREVRKERGRPGGPPSGPVPESAPRAAMPGEVAPLPGDADRQRGQPGPSRESEAQNRTHSDPTDEPGSPSEESEDLKFWEARVAEFLRETE